MLTLRSNDAPPFTILVIDDQRSTLKLMKNRLRAYGCKVVTVDSAEEALEMIEWGLRFSLIITDLKMPWLDGVQFCRRIKARYPETKIVALSGNLAAYDRQELESSGFDGIYQKPVCNQLVRQMLKHAVQA